MRAAMRKACAQPVQTGKTRGCPAPQTGPRCRTSMTARLLALTLALTLAFAPVLAAAELDARLAELTTAQPVAIAVLVARDGR